MCAAEGIVICPREAARTTVIIVEPLSGTCEAPCVSWVPSDIKVQTIAGR